LGSCPDGLRLSRLVVLARASDVTEPRLSRLPDAEALGLLVGQSSSLAQLDAPLRTLEHIVSGVGGVWRLEYAEIVDAAPMLVELLDRDFAPTPATGTRVFASPVRDALVVDDGIAVLTGDRLVHLTGVGAEVWRAAQGGASLPELEAAVTARLGAHPAARSLVAGAVQDLRAHGVLRDADAGADLP
jgi:hypothetical protein